MSGPAKQAATAASADLANALARADAAERLIKAIEVEGHRPLLDRLRGQFAAADRLAAFRALGDDPAALASALRAIGGDYERSMLFRDLDWLVMRALVRHLVTHGDPLERGLDCAGTWEGWRNELAPQVAAELTPDAEVPHHVAITAPREDVKLPRRELRGEAGRVAANALDAAGWSVEETTAQPTGSYGGRMGPIPEADCEFRVEAITFLGPAYRPYASNMERPNPPPEQVMLASAWQATVEHHDEARAAAERGDLVVRELSPAEDRAVLHRDLTVRSRTGADVLQPFRGIARRKPEPASAPAPEAPPAAPPARPRLREVARPETTQPLVGEGRASRGDTQQ